MIFPVNFLAPAVREFREAVAWYDAQSPGLGSRFRAEVSLGIARITRHPSLWAQISPDIRRYRMTRFPYAILYVLLEDRVLVVAVSHFHRKPDHWRGRWAEGGGR